MEKNYLYWDVIFSYKKTKKANEQEKKCLLANSIINSFDMLDGYKKIKYK
jgi:hypothetical protein